MKYKITLNESQAHIICNAVELLARIGIGQIEAIHMHMWHFDRSAEFHKRIGEFREAVTGSRDGFGIHQAKVPGYFRDSWDIMQVIRHRLAWDKHPGGGMTVNFDTPMKSGKEDLPTIERIEDDGVRRPEVAKSAVKGKTKQSKTNSKR